MSQNPPVFGAIRAGDADRLRELVAADPNVATHRNDAGVSAVLFAQYQWRMDLVEILLETRPELDVFEAAAIGNAKRVADLLAGDPSLANAWSADGFTPLHLAAYFGHPEVARRLLGFGAEVAAMSRNSLAVMPLHSAAAGGQIEVARELIDHGAEVDPRTHGGATPLLDAAQSGDPELVELLLEHGADPSARLDDGRDAVALAEAGGYPRVAGLLRHTR